VVAVAAEAAEAAAVATTMMILVVRLAAAAAAAVAAVAVVAVAVAVAVAVVLRLVAAAATTTTTTVVVATTTSHSERMRALLELTRALAALAALAATFGFSQGCAKKLHGSERGSPSAAALLADLPEPSGVLAELSVAHPDATFRSLRELGRPLSGLLPAGFPMLTASLLGLPALTADSFDPDLPVVGLLLQSGASPPTWLLAVHAVSGPELIAKLCTGDRAPFRAVAGVPAGLRLIQPSVQSTKTAPALAVFDNYLLVAENADSLLSAGPYAARMLPKHPPACGSVEQTSARTAWAVGRLPHPARAPGPDGSLGARRACS